MFQRCIESIGEDEGKHYNKENIKNNTIEEKLKYVKKVLNKMKKLKENRLHI